MPRGDGTGPFGRGPGSGRGRGMGKGAGMGRMGGNRAGAGPAGNCICPTCGTKMPHQAGTPCSSMNCPKCGINIVRE
jgi:hypothetical protein